MEVLIRQIRDAYHNRFPQRPAADAARRFVEDEFAARNIQPTPELVDRLVAHLLDGVPFGHLSPVTIRHCGS